MIDDSTATTTMTINKINSTIVSIVPKEKKKKCRCYTRHLVRFLTRQVNKRILEKYQNEAREKSCRSWPFPLVK
ncbi:unnamed protein product, partial [Rotaria sordida]